MRYILILTTLLAIIKLNAYAQSTVFNTPLPNCTVGQDTVIFQSNFQNNDGGFKSIGINNAAPSTEFEWGFLLPLAAVNNCDNACGPPIATVPTASNGLTRMWGTNLDGCYPNSNNGGNDSMVLVKFIDFTAVNLPYQLTFQHWYDKITNAERIFIRLNGIPIFEDISGSTLPWTDQTITVNTGNPGSNLAGQQKVKLEFLMRTTTVCNKRGWYLSNVGLRTCKGTSGGGGGTPAVPTMGEWGLFILFLTLVYFSIGFIVNISGNTLQLKQIFSFEQLNIRNYINYFMIACFIMSVLLFVLHLFGNTLSSIDVLGAVFSASILGLIINKLQHTNE